MKKVFFITVTILFSLSACKKVECIYCKERVVACEDALGQIQQEWEQYKEGILAIDSTCKVKTVYKD